MTAREIEKLLNSLSSNGKKITFDMIQEEESQDIFFDSLFSNGIYCPICGNGDGIIKNWKQNCNQRYLCKNCRKTFVANTNSVLERMHKSLSILKKFFECMVHGMSIMKTAEICCINKNSTFAWLHKVLDTLSTIVEDTALDFIVEEDETFFVMS